MINYEGLYDASDIVGAIPDFEEGESSLWVAEMVGK